MRSRFKIYADQDMYFITSTAIEWTPLFINEELFQIILNSLKYCQQNKNLYIYGYVIMPNHFHAIISMDEPGKIPPTVRDLKRHTSQQISNYLKGIAKKVSFAWIRPFIGQEINYVWQKGYHPEAIHSEKWFLQKLNYIHRNPVEKGFVERPEHWKYSSARNYILGDDSLFKLDTGQLG